MPGLLIWHAHSSTTAISLSTQIAGHSRKDADRQTDRQAGNRRKFVRFGRRDEIHGAGARRRANAPFGRRRSDAMRLAPARPGQQNAVRVAPHDLRPVGCRRRLALASCSPFRPSPRRPEIASARTSPSPPPRKRLTRSIFVGYRCGVAGAGSAGRRSSGR